MRPRILDRDRKVGQTGPAIPGAAFGGAPLGQVWDFRTSLAHSSIAVEEFLAPFARLLGVFAIFPSTFAPTRGFGRALGPLTPQLYPAYFSVFLASAMQRPILAPWCSLGGLHLAQTCDLG